MDALAVTPEQSWQARLELQLKKKNAVTRLSRARHLGPLYVQKPFYPEGKELAHIYLLHPPGGIVSGDALEIDIQVGEGAGALITTPGAARVYRARSDNPQQRQQVRLSAGAGGTLEWFPLETIVYNGSCVEMETTIDLQPGASFIGWEVTCFGLPASNEPFSSGSFRQRYQLRRDGAPVFIDQLHIDDSNRQLLDSTIGMAESAVSGFLLAGPMPDDSTVLLEKLRRAAEQDGLAKVGAISLVGEFVVGRYLGNSAEQARTLFALWWRQLRPLVVGREKCAPRIWLT